MTNLSFYEQTGIVIPGALFLFGVVLLVPEIRALVAADGVTVGGLGMFLLISYAAGHLIAAGGNAIEWALWKMRNGMPTDWITHPDPKIVSAEQVAQITDRVRKRLGLQISAIQGMPLTDWRPIFGQLYRDVLRHNAGRIEILNGNYGLNRGLSASMFFLCGAVLIYWHNAALAGALLAGGLVFLYRMHRFGVHFARELYFRFLALPAESPKTSST